MKRILMVFPKSEWKMFEKQINQDLPALGEMLVNAYSERLSKVVFLKDYEDFQSKYPFLCISE